MCLFCKDLAANFLIANGAGGRMPHRLQTETGFDEMSSMSGSSNKKTELEDNLSEAKSHRKRVGDFLDKVSHKWQKEEREEEGNKTDRHLNEVHNCSVNVRDESALETMSPESKDVHLEALKKQRKDVLKKLQEDH